MSLVSRLLKKSTIEETALLKESKLFEKKDLLITDIPALNIALSGTLTRGMGPGVLQIAGKSKRFKSKFALLLASVFQTKFPEGAILFYDSEFGSPESYWDRMNPANVIHSPIWNLQSLTHDMVTQLEELSVKDNEKLLIIIDSLGNAASLKEVSDAMKSSEVPADMTRAKAIKSMFRIIAPYINVKNVYLIAVNHTYNTLELYSTEIVGGGSGNEYNSNGIWIISRAADKDKKTKVVEGYDFTIRVNKSRYVKEDRRIPISVSFEKGIYQWSGLLDMAIEGGFVLRPTTQKYTFAHHGEYAQTYDMKEIEGNDEFFKELLSKTEFSKWVEEEFTL